MVVPYGDSMSNPLETRKSYCKASKVYLVITPSDKKILDMFCDYLTMMETTKSSDFDNIAKKTSDLKKKISQYLDGSPFSVWRRIWLLHERWVANDLIYLSINNEGSLEMTETSGLISRLEQFCAEFIKNNSINQKLCCFCKDLLFIDETILSQRKRESPHLKYLSENYQTFSTDSNLRLIIHSFNIHGSAASTVTLSKALSTCGTNVEKLFWESEYNENWTEFNAKFK
ncbi:hypothetical protein MP638_006433 [Amoeboaphelidium occidentale]|nr:hypothetical protein MP638_006433 [Amoeboaphelidium occidentale]